MDDVNKSRRKRIRVYVDDEFAPGEEEAPKSAPAWTKTGYNESLKKTVNRYVRSDINEMAAVTENINEEDDNEENIEDDNDGDKSNHESVERPRSVVSEEYNSSSDNSNNSK